MTLAFDLDRPATRTIAPRSPLVSQRTSAEAPLHIVPKTEPAAPRSTDETIRLIDLAAQRMADSVHRAREQEQTIAALREHLAQLEKERDATEAYVHEIESRMQDAEQRCETLESQSEIQGREHDRLKANIDRLLAIFSASPGMSSSGMSSSGMAPSGMAPSGMGKPA